MKSIEISGKTIDEAIEKGLKKLNCNRDAVEIEIIEAPSKGIFGIFGVKDAKIKLNYIIDNFDKNQEAETSETFPLSESRSEIKIVNEEPEPEKNHSLQSIESNHIVQNDNDLPETAAIQFLENIFNKIEVQVETEVSKKDDFLYLSFRGEDLGILIGRRGETLDSLQYLTNLVVGKKFGQRYRIILDVEGYRERREQTLINLALRLSEKVKRTGHNIVLEPMNPHERRIIHTALQNDSKVRTFSEGEEPHRKVVITKRTKS
ncbi:RNA-binding cell elongation regulator Jag/EloR [Dehalobacterium formicoaceticum]|uniref:RNA-binding protein KhpB n=1 Tax=Dehalobacterium formicoaceticum TaxID=51515 RepID=A0ABT1Y434_9FIRM|nr:RNA-binding cell elongation regulator Jag/EloR [Dehalobacterium formicoaceticum]MCR6545642.1 protein jag [Dehalobacterium formicoaceticum]